MKYLIGFNENLDEFEKFCRDNLAYLLDEGFGFEKISRDGNHYISMCLYKKDPRRTSPALVHTSGFYWNDIKDDFIPFLELFNEKFSSGKYSIKGINFFRFTSLTRTLPSLVIFILKNKYQQRINHLMIY